MKKLLLSAAIAVFAMSNINAQEVKFGVKAGADFASIRVDYDGDNISTSETGFYLGAFAEIKISESFIFQPEVLYVSVEDLDQIAIPLMAKIPVSDKFNVLAGPALGILLDTAEDMKSLNFGLEAGVAYDVSENFLLEARYNLGLANLQEDAPSGYSAKLSGFFVGVGYKF
ncbi:opacity protein-like surface antigen [Mariniflexile fucanivorans]|uniref:Opacity protein-like surface antigen n=1 Tax=Mariniflexile fucanivorans TaxID=264023 RepID=A0A4R1REP4_9FLAO|nr:porin family protein [Mariniflexile fucanivorans]TCL64022.1 opacity protein-like surface antigen [Mariniflexile fucanivorans]